MKQFLPVVWWLTATLVIAFVLVGLGYLFADALLLGVLFLPGMLTARYFVPQLSFENRRQGILDTVYLALAILGYNRQNQMRRSSEPDATFGGLK